MNAPSPPVKTSFFARVSTWFILNTLVLICLLILHFWYGFAQTRWWPDAFAVAINLLAGGLVSFLFYFLVVHLPEKRKKSIIKTNLLRVYGTIKTDIIWAIVNASIKGGRHDLAPSIELVDKLKSTSEFKAAFEHGQQGTEGFYAFENEMCNETEEFREIVQNLTMLLKQIEFVLHNYSIESQPVFDFFKRLELLLMRLQASGPGYDESKPLCRFIWGIFAGWNEIEGYTGRDIIEDMIKDL